MQLGDAVVVAVEEREEVLGEVALVLRAQRADDAEVDGGVFRVLRVVDQHEDIARVHVGMEEVVAKHLREKNLHAVFRELLDVGPGGAQRLHVADRRAEDALLHQHLGPAVVPVDLGHVQHVRVFEVALELRRVCGLAHQVELVDDRVLVFVDDLERPQALAVFPVAVGEPGERAQHVEVALDLVLHARAQHLDDDLGAVHQLRRVHLRDRGGGERRYVEALEHIADRLVVGRLDDLDRLLGRERRHGVLQFRQLVGDVGRQQVAARRDRLAELDEDRAEFLERQADALADRRRAVAAARRQVEQETQRPQQVRLLDDVVEAVLDQHALDRDQAKQCAAARHQSCSRRRMRAASRSTSSRSASTSAVKRSTS